MITSSQNFFVSNKCHEIQGVTIGGRRWIIGSSVGRAMCIQTPKSFAKTLLRKAQVRDWKESFVVDGVAMNREEQLYAVQRRVLSAELAVFCTAHMRVSDSQISVFKMLMSVYRIGFDLSIKECSMKKFTQDAKSLEITIS